MRDICRKRERERVCVCVCEKTEVREKVVREHGKCAR